MAKRSSSKSRVAKAAPQHAAKTPEPKKAEAKAVVKPEAAKPEAAKPEAAKPVKSEPKTAQSSVDESKSFEENLQATLDEEAPVTAASTPIAGTAQHGGEIQDVPVQNLLGEFQTKCEQMAGKIPFPKCAFCDKMAEPRNVEIEELGGGLLRVLQESPMNELVNDVSAVVTNVAGKLGNVVAIMRSKLKHPPPPL
uniref:Uncharacterized protein n=1 Tax=Magnetovibrio blakemorei TaxID=28181 RepID=C4RAE4_9PROT|nr:hypothetical protein mv1g00042 [Magnetovibrio blakemorei]